MPSMLAVAAPRSVVILAPSSVRHSSIASVSSANSTPSSVLFPGASAAHTRARFVRLFDPGITTEAATGATSGSIGSGSRIIRSGAARDGGRGP